MKINIQIKAAGKRKAILNQEAYELPRTPTSLDDFITLVVINEVTRYNNQAVDADLMPYLTAEDYAMGESIGKIGFKDRKNDANQDVNAAIANAKLAFEDGLYRVFINDTEATADAPFSLNEADTVTFIRLTFLAGRRF